MKVLNRRKRKSLLDTWLVQNAPRSLYPLLSLRVVAPLNKTRANDISAVYNWTAPGETVDRERILAWIEVHGDLKMNTAAGCWLHSLDLGERAISTEIVACTHPLEMTRIGRKGEELINYVSFFFFFLKIWNFLLPSSFSLWIFTTVKVHHSNRYFYLILFDFIRKFHWSRDEIDCYCMYKLDLLLPAVLMKRFILALRIVNYSKETCALFVLQLLQSKVWIKGNITMSR